MDDMDIKQLRVAVAQDVLKILELNQVTPTKGTYLTSEHSGMYALSARRLQSQMLQDPPPCNVCALGLSVLALIRVNNHIAGKDLHLPSRIAENALGEKFAGLVEAAFECWVVDADGNGDPDGELEPVDLLTGNRDLRQRARLVMEAIIETEGDEDRLRDRLFESTGEANV